MNEDDKKDEQPDEEPQEAPQEAPANPLDAPVGLEDPEVPPPPPVVPEGNGNGVDIIAPITLEDYDIPEDEPDLVVPTVEGAIRYAFIGTGQGGGRLAAEAYKLGYKKAVVINTAKQDLQLTDVPPEHKLLLDIGPGGAGKDPSRGEEAATKHQQEIFDLMRRVFGRQIDHIMICAGAGGGSGGGSVIPIATVIAKRYLQSLGYSGEELDKRVGVILTLPRAMEQNSPRVAQNAVTVAERVSELAESNSITPLIIVDNAKITSMYPKLTQATLWPTVNQGVMQLFNIFNQLPLLPSPYTSFDAADYETTMRCGGHMVMGVTSVKPELIKPDMDETDLSRMLRHSLDKTLLAEGFDLHTAKYVAGVISGSNATMANLPDSAVQYVYDMLSKITGCNTLHQGQYEDNRDGIRIYTVIAGLQRPEKRYAQLRELAREKYP
jgi:cell division GTPase FtsZ